MAKRNNKNVSIRYLFSLAGHQNGKLSISVIFGILSGIAMFVPFYCVYRVMSALFENSNDEIFIWGIIAACCIFLRFLFHGASSALSHLCAYNTLYTVRKKICDHIGKVNLGFFGDTSSGEIKKVLMEDVERLEHFLAHQIPDITVAIVVPIIVLIFLLTVNVPMALILLVPIIVSFIVQGIMLSVYGPVMNEYAVVQGKMNSAVVQFISGMPIMKAYNLNADTYSAYSDSNKVFNTLWKKVSRTAAPLSSVCTVLVESGIFFAVPFGGWLFFKGTLQPTEYIFFIVMSIVFLTSFSNLMSFAQIFSQISAGLERIKEVMEVPELSIIKNEQSYNDNSCIQFCNVSFAYQEKPVLEHINLQIQQGSFAAFVGASGAGKSTAAQLIPRFWDVSDGSIMINGRNVRSYQADELMEQISFVFQDTFMMESSIFDNIAMGKLNCTKEDVINAAKAAQIHELILSLPNGYDTQYGTLGVKLSGGERQRICIARAILKNSPILIFDEATSFADVENEHKIQLALNHLMEGKTIIMIAHRLHTIINADCIFVFDKGRTIPYLKRTACTLICGSTILREECNNVILTNG